MSIVPQFVGGVVDPAFRRAGSATPPTGSVGRFVALAILLFTSMASPQPSRYFAIRVVDDQTQRGVPLVELRTVNEQRFVTDSAGYIALDEPDLMGREVYFRISSHGYEYPADGFGMRGVRLKPEAGAEKVIKIKRLNIAERLYRVTGAGIYRDSVLLGKKPPIAEPLLNAQVLGQDSVMTAVYDGKLYWFWGDTNRLSYPLGHFGTAAATSQLPGMGGLDPSLGVDLTYFVGKDGFSRGVCEVPGQGMKWMDAVMVVPDEAGKPRLVSRYAIMKSLGECVERGVAAWDDAAQAFKPLSKLPKDETLYPWGQALQHEGYVYFASAYPLTRVKADLKSVQDVTQYEGYSPLVAGTRFAREKTQLQRDADGRLVFDWKRDTPAISQDQEEALVKAGLIKPQERYYTLRDPSNDKSVKIHYGSVSYNAFKKKWIMIAAEYGGSSSFLGETWLVQADALTGPWKGARKIVAHDKYSFYNPKHHAFFDQEGGRYIYFEGTYTATFSRQHEPTPRYDYNQIMYRLDLADPRLEAR